MMGTINCVYETPCGWCSKWDKKCDKKIIERGQRAKCNPVDDAVDSVTKEYIKSTLINKVCESEEDHEWEWVLASTAENTFRCKKCGACRVYPIDYNITTTTSSI